MDIFARDMVVGHTYFVSDDTSAAGSNDNGDCYNPVLSSDGNVVAFAAEVNDGVIMVRNLLTDTTQLVSVSTAGPFQANDGSHIGSINADGSVVAFTSDASDLVDRDYNGMSDAFVAAISWSTPVLPGDYNGDGSVDSSDYILWRKGSGRVVAPYTGADGSGNGIVGSEDYDVWRAHNGQSLAAASGASLMASVEPGAISSSEDASGKGSASLATGSAARLRSRVAAGIEALIISTLLPKDAAIGRRTLEFQRRDRNWLGNSRVGEAIHALVVTMDKNHAQASNSGSTPNEDEAAQPLTSNSAAKNGIAAFDLAFSGIDDSSFPGDLFGRLMHSRLSFNQ
jgi:hypothetical protein